MVAVAERLAGQVALVTGAASGIGRATAERLAAEGAAVLAADRDAAGLAATCDAIASAGGRATAWTLDVTRPAECLAAVDAAREHYERLDLLCNVAGIALGARFTDVTEAQWSQVLAVNLSGVFFMCQAAIPALLETRGAVVNMASSAALVGQAYTAPYAASKAGVVSLTRSLALEYGKQGLRANCVCPGGVDTPLARGFRLPEDADPELFRRMLPLVPVARPDEIAGAVAYLASPEARYVNGAVLAIDGGQTAG